MVTFAEWSVQGTDESAHIQAVYDSLMADSEDNHE